MSSLQVLVYSVRCYSIVLQEELHNYTSISGEHMTLAASITMAIVIGTYHFLRCSTPRGVTMLINYTSISGNT